VFEGSFVPRPAGSELRVRVHLWGALVLFVWLALVSSRDALILAGCFLVGGYVALVVQFWAEVRRGLAVLKKAVNSD
jgi:hypothetical protein